MLVTFAHMRFEGLKCGVQSKSILLVRLEGAKASHTGTPADVHGRLGGNFPFPAG